MELFRQIEDHFAIVRYPKGVMKQVKLYTRKTRVYIPHSGGYVEVKGLEIGSGYYFTSHPDIKVIEFDKDKIEHIKNLGFKSPRYTGDS